MTVHQTQRPSYIIQPNMCALSPMDTAQINDRFVVDVEEHIVVSNEFKILISAKLIFKGGLYFNVPEIPAGGCKAVIILGSPPPVIPVRIKSKAGINL